MTRPAYHIPFDDDETYRERMEREAAEQFLSGRMTLPEQIDPEETVRLAAELDAEDVATERE